MIGIFMSIFFSVTGKQVHTFLLEFRKLEINDWTLERKLIISKIFA